MATSFMLAAKLVVLLQLLLFSRSLKTGPNMRDTPPSICQLRRPTDDYLNHKIAEWEKASGVEIWVENVRGGNVALTVEIHVFSKNWTSLELQVRPLDKLTAIGGWTLLDDARKDIKTASCASPSDTAILYNIRNKENSNKTRLKLRWKSVTPVFDNLEIIVLINRNSTSWFTVTSSLMEKISTARKARSTDLCGVQPCLNGGVCGGDGIAETCTCPHGYHGEFCEMPNLCSSEPCQNGGACVQSGDMIVCTCEEGYGGMLCELYETRCEDQPCLNGATCYQDPNTPQFVCTCTVGFIGVNCEIDIDNSCASDPCVYGSCSNAHTGYLCDCMQGWTGKNCHQEINLSGNGFLISTTEQDGDSLPRLPKDDEGLDAAVVTAIALSMVIGIVIGIVVTVFIYCVRKRRIRRDAYLRSGEKMNNRHETTDQEATVDNDMVLRSYESMTSIDELPDPTPAVILTRETYYELGDDQLRNNEHVSQGREPISANEDALPDRIHNNLAPSLNDSEEDNELAITVDSVAH